VTTPIRVETEEEEREGEAASPAYRVARFGGRVIVYALLLAWTLVALFPLYWTLSTSVKLGRDVTQGHLIPWVDFSPSWKGWQSLGLSPDTIFQTSNVREEFLKKFINSVILALLDTRTGLILLYSLMVLPIVVWVMRDQFDTIPVELEQAALVDGCSIWGAFFRIVLPIALPGMVAAFILSLVLCWNEYFFASLLTGFDAQTLPVMVASQTGSQGINWWAIAALATAAITPLLLIGVFLERYIVMGLTAGSGK
jgi:multiple sugar transport system permease protein